MLLDVLINPWPVVRGCNLDICFESGIVTSKDTVMGFAKSFFLVFLWQQKCSPGVVVVGEPDPENALLVMEHLLDQFKVLIDVLS
jgi:hypothetical protein